MNLASLLSAMSPDVYERLRSAVETGKWPDGTVLNEEQRAKCMQAVLLYQSKVQKSTEHMTVNEQGDIVHKSKRDFKEALASLNDDLTIQRFKQDDI